MIFEGCVRGLAVGAAAIATAGLALPANAAATPTIGFKTQAVPVPGVPGTGDFLGAGAVIKAEGTILGTEYGGAPPPLAEIRYFAPAGTKLHPNGFATCAPSVIEASGPAACPKRSTAGPKGKANGVVSFGGERVPETATVQSFFAPGGTMVTFVDGVSPALIEIVVPARVTSAAPPFGHEFSDEVPLIETVPGALDASTVGGTVEVGAAYQQGKKTISYITLPKTCPKGGWPEKVQVSFLGGVTAEEFTKMPCPRR